MGAELNLTMSSSVLEMLQWGLRLVLLVLEGGLHIELQTLRKVGVKATAIALTGTLLPILITTAVFAPLDQFSFKEAVVAGTSLSSTAIGALAQQLFATYRASTQQHTAVSLHHTAL